MTGFAGAGGTPAARRYDDARVEHHTRPAVERDGEALMLLRHAYLVEHLVYLRAEAVAEWLSYDHEWWRQFIITANRSSDQLLLVSADDNGTIGGMGRAVLLGDGAEFSMLYIDAAKRGEGRARSLLEHGTEWARHQGAHWAQAWITRNNWPSEVMHQVAGWEPSGEQREGGLGQIERVWRVEW